MNRLLALLSTVLLAFSMGACSDNSGQEPNPDPGPNPTPDPGKDEPVGGGVAIPIQLLIEKGSLINSYIDPTGLEVSLSNQGKNIEVRCYGDKFYYSRILGREWTWWNQTPIGMTPTEEMYAGFEALAAANGDTGFDGAVSVFLFPYGMDENTCLSQPIRSIEVTGAKAWDEEHPAGAPLGDMIRVFAPRYSEIFDSGYELLYPNWGTADRYDPEEYPRREDFPLDYSSRDADWKLLSELDETDLAIFPARFTLKSLPYLPLSGQRITVKITLADGTVLTGVCQE